MPTAASSQGGERVCAVSDRCGGCDCIEEPYAQQLKSKQARIEELFADHVRNGTVVRPILGMDDPYRYRNKVISPYVAAAPSKRRGGNSGSGKGPHAKKGGGRPSHAILTGMYERGTHRLIPAEICMTENERAKRVTLAVRDIMERYGMEPYDEDAQSGFMRHCQVRAGHTSGEVLVTLVTNGEVFPSSKAFCRELVKRCPYITTIVQNVNTRATNVILGDRERVLYGPGFILDTLCGLSFRISSKSFYQVNASQTEVLYRTAIDLARVGAETTVIDAYCGTGTIGLAAAAAGAGEVIGVDETASSIDDARENARHNGIDRARFVTADAGDFLRGLAAGIIGGAAGDADAHRGEANGFAPVDAGGEGATVYGAKDVSREIVLMMDPPRAGSSEEFLDAACALAPARIVYISCNPLTQKRDVDRLCHHGYELETVVPVDMFPHTSHIETVALLNRI